MIIDEAIQQPGQKERLFKEAIYKDLHVAIPGEIISYNANKKTVNVQPTIRERDSMENPPILVDVPVFFFGGFTFTPKKGDGCLVVCADSCVDAWLQSGGVNSPSMSRKHSLSDGFAFVGFNVQEGKDLIGLLNSKVDKVNGGVGDIVLFGANGSIADSEKKLTDFLLASNVKNNLTTTAEGYVLDARQGKALKDLIDAIERYTAGTGLTLDGTQFKITQANVYQIINLLSEGESNSQGDDFIITQYAGGGTGNTTYYRRKLSKVINSTLVKAALGTNSNHNNDFLRKDGTWAKPDLSSKVSKSGDTMTGSLTLKSGAKIRYEGTAMTGDILRVVDDGDAYGLGVVIGRGGLVVIGAGESQDAIASGKTAGEETLYLGSDGDIVFFTKVQDGVATAKKITFNTLGQIVRNFYNNSSWHKGRENAVLRVVDGGDGYHPIISAKSYSGSWELGPYTTTNGLYLTFISDSRYNADQNVQGGQYYFKPLGENKLADMANAIKSITRSGLTFTATRMDDTTFTFTQQDNNSWRGYQVKQWQASYTVAANGEKQIKGSDLGISTPSGYSPVAVAYFNTSNSNVDVFYLDATATGNSVVATLRNRASSQITGTFAMKILYLQN